MLISAVFFTLGPLAWSAPAAAPQAAAEDPPAAVNADRVTILQDADRTWIGPEWYANRLQDWRLRDGRIECVNGAERYPVRVAHLLPWSIGPGESFRLSVRLDALVVGLDDEACSGFLIGTGGDGVDWRLSALAHHRPAEDGGVFVGVDAQGQAVLRDFETNRARGGWGVGGKLADGEFERLPLEPLEADPGAMMDATAPETSKDPAGGSLAVVAVRVPGADGAADGYRVTITVLLEDGRVLSKARSKVLPAAWVEGGIALGSHGGAPFSEAGFSFSELELAGDMIRHHPERRFGPIVAAQYTVSRGTLKMTAQMMPLGPKDGSLALLQLAGSDGGWQTVASADLQVPSWTFPFRVESWDGSRDHAYRVLYRSRGEDHEWRGTIRAEPTADRDFVLAAFTGNKHFTGGIRWNSNGVWFPHNDIVNSVREHDPDLLFFSGDQIYEGDITGAQRRPADQAKLDYLDKWYRWCWAFGDLARDRPTICIPDDHDVYHGNIWGAGGRAARRQDDGGYTMPADFVRMVERTQTSHLPDPVDPAPVEQGIGVYFTELNYGGISFAILEDRKFKSSATPTVPDGQVKNGWFQNAFFDPRDADVPEAVLLGERQERFLEQWSADWSNDAWMKVVLSQTIFQNAATIPGDSKGGHVLPSAPYPEIGQEPKDWKLAADTDSNGWPQSGRRRALEAMRKGFAFHVAGDQHLGSFLQYGVDDWRDAGHAFCVPSIANTWPRRWYPPEGGANPLPGQPYYTGDYTDGFGNKMTMYAVSNPYKWGREPAALHNRAPGYGIVRFDRSARTIRAECWPRWSAPGAGDDEQYPGWPITLTQAEQYAPPGAALLNEIQVEGLDGEPVFEVYDERTGERIYSIRWPEPFFSPWVPDAGGEYRVRVGDPDTGRWQELSGLDTAPRGRARVLRF